MANKPTQQGEQPKQNRLIIGAGLGVALAVLVVLIWIVLRLLIANQAIAQGTGELPPAANSPLQLISNDEAPSNQPIQQDGPPPDAGAPPGASSGGNNNRNLPDEGPNDVPPGAPQPAGNSSSIPLILSAVSLVLSLGALGISLFLLLGKDEAQT